MAGYTVMFPNRQTIELPARTEAAIAQARARYAEPLWLFRAERVLKLSDRQWIHPESAGAAQRLFATHPHGLIAFAWKLFGRGWAGSAEAYAGDAVRYPQHPRHLGLGVIPLVDEDRDDQQIGWVRILQVTPEMDHNYAIFVQFAVLDLFAPRPLPAEYATGAQ